ncbi:Agamous-like MADS-box protein mads1 [Ranunculus cassubicifolius]
MLMTKIDVMSVIPKTTLTMTAHSWTLSQKTSVLDLNLMRFALVVAKLECVAVPWVHMLSSRSAIFVLILVTGTGRENATSLPSSARLPKALSPTRCPSRIRFRPLRNPPCSVRKTIERYKKASSDSSNTGSVSEANAQFYQQEAIKMRNQIATLQNNNKNLLGESLSNLSIRELRAIEKKIALGITKIRSKKNELLFAEIEYMQKRELDLQNDNMYLRAKIAENERTQQHMSLMPSNGYEVISSAPYDSRNFMPVNLLESNNNYSRNDQTTLQLG